MLTFLGLADAKKPRWIVWENVPGVLSSNGGKDFATFLGALGELGYGFAYRVLDAQYFGVAQRRRRVFVVGYLGYWRPAAAVLFERESLSGHTKPSRKKRQEASTGAEGGVRATSPDGRETIGTLRQRDYKGIVNDDLESGRGLAIEVKQVAQPIAVDCFNQTINEKTTQTIGSSASDANHVGAVLQPIQISFNDANGTRADRPNGGCYIIENPQSSPALTLADSPVKVLQPTIIDRAAFNQGENAQYEPRIEEGQTMSSLVAKGPHAVQHTMAIRRLTPRECERLQGFPDDWTLIPYRNKSADQCPDGPRYKACGNSMAVPVMRWIGQRIQLIDTIIN